MKRSVFFLVYLLAFTLVSASVPKILNYQGVLKNASGEPIEGTKNVNFMIYNVPTDGTPYWAETSSVEFKKGLFNVILGTYEPLNLPFDEQYYLSINIDGEELLPRIRLAAVPYSFNTENVRHGKIVNSAIDATAIGEINPSTGKFTSLTLVDQNSNSWSVNLITSVSMSNNYTLTLPPNDGESDQLLYTDGTGNLNWKTLIGMPSGTLGQTIRNDGNVWISNDNLYNNGSSVGIGTTSPNEKLTVKGTLSLNEISSEPSTTSSYGKLYTKSSDNQLYFQDDAGNKTQLGLEFAAIEDKKTSGSDGGGYSASEGWKTRELNTIVSRGNSISLSSNQIKLKIGTYRIIASAPAYRSGNHQIRLRQTSGTPATLLLGTTVWSSTDDLPMTRSFIDGIINIEVDNTTCVIEHKCQNTKSTSGLGRAVSFGEGEVYTKVFIQKLY